MIECDMCAGKTIEKKGITNSPPTYNLQAEHRKEINAMSPFPLRDHFASCGRVDSPKRCYEVQTLSSFYSSIWFKNEYFVAKFLAHWTSRR